MAYREPWKHDVKEVQQFGDIQHNRDRRLHDTDVFVPPSLKEVLKAIPDSNKRARIRKSVKEIISHIKSNPTDGVTMVIDGVVEETRIQRTVVREAISLLLYTKTVSIARDGSLVLAKGVADSAGKRA